jgi:hypothetical protein
MPGTTADIWAIVVVATLSVAAMLILVVWYAPRAQERQAAGGVQVRGPVQGGRQVGSGPSAGSRLDAPATEGATVPSPRSPAAEDSNVGDTTREQATHGSSGSPMDL